MTSKRLKIAVIAGEVSGDLLGADLISALKKTSECPVDLIGVGGEALEAEGLSSFFDFSELSIMGFTQVLARLPKLLGRIRQTADAIIDAKPDLLLIIDSPGFTHRVARRVREKLPTLPVVKYVCPSVWAWKEYRARKMLGYVDHVLAVLPFEPDVMKRLGGPPTTYIGHRLTADPSVQQVRAARALRKSRTPDRKTILLLPGSRSTEIRRLMPVFDETVREFSRRNGETRFLLPTVARQEKLVRELVANWDIKPDITSDAQGKWAAFAAADAAIAASGTVILELGLCGVPVVSVYKTDWLVTLISHRIKAWTAALPNLIADSPIVPEFFNHSVRPGYLCRWTERFASDTLQRQAILEGYELVWQNFAVSTPPGEKGAEIVLELLRTRHLL